MFTRGCTFPCTFCASHSVHGRRVRAKSKDRVLAEMRYLRDNLSFATISIEDDLFAADQKKFEQISEELRRYSGHVKYLLPQGLSAHLLNEKLINWMIEMGIDEAAVAIESGSPFVQKQIIKKHIDLDKARRTLETLRSRNFHVYVNFILGFPDETREMMEESISYMRSLDTDWIYIFHALPLPGSDIYRTLLERGTIDSRTFDWDGLRLGRRTFDSPEISATDLERLVYDTNIELNFLQNSNLRNKRFERAALLFNRHILTQYPYHIVGRYCRGVAHLGMGDQRLADTDFRECLSWVSKDPEASRLFLRYGSQMPLLTRYEPLDRQKQQSNN